MKGTLLTFCTNWGFTVISWSMAFSRSSSSMHFSIWWQTRLKVVSEFRSAYLRFNAEYWHGATGSQCHDLERLALRRFWNQRFECRKLTEYKCRVAPRRDLGQHPIIKHIQICCRETENTHTTRDKDYTSFRVEFATTLSYQTPPVFTGFWILTCQRGSVEVYCVTLHCFSASEI